MPFSFALEDAAAATAAEPEAPDHLLLEYAFPTAYAIDNNNDAIEEYEERPVLTELDDDVNVEELDLELTLGLDQYDALQDLLFDTMDNSDGSSGGEAVGANGSEAFYELTTAMEMETHSDGLMDEDGGHGNGASDPAATHVENGGRALLIEADAAESATKQRRRRPRAAATKKQLIKSSSTNKAKNSVATNAVNSGIVNTSNNNSNGVKKQLKYNSNKARDERREELLYLRRKVKDLEAQLVELRKDSSPPQLKASQHDVEEDGDEEQHCLTVEHLPKNQRRKARARTRPEEATMVPASMSVWHEIASRQHEHRMKAERENIRLKLVLENQLKIAKSLEKLLKKTSSTKEFEKCINKSGDPQQRVRYAVGRPSVTHATTDAELFEKLLAGVEQSYKEVDDVFEATGLSRMESSRIDARVQQRRHNHWDVDSDTSSHHPQIELQVFGSKVMPFNMHSTGLAVWNHYVFAKERIPNRFYCHNSPQTMVNSTADTIMENFNVEVDVNSTSVLFCLKLVLRRYIEEERIVIVWRAFFDPTQVSNEPLSGVRFLEKGYVVVKKHDNKNSGNGVLTSEEENHNLLQTCFISTPVSIGDLVHADPSKVGALTDLVLSATAANIASSHQMIENVLLEQAMRK